MKSILDPSFRYTKSVDTDVRNTFARIRREQRQQLGADAEAAVESDGHEEAQIRDATERHVPQFVGGVTKPGASR